MDLFPFNPNYKLCSSWSAPLTKLKHPLLCYALYTAKGAVYSASGLK